MNNLKSNLCILPWIHASVGTQGSVFPCCRVICFEPDQFGNLHSSDLQTIRDNSSFTDFRSKMLDGEKPEICRGCYKEEYSGLKSLRTESNIQYEKLVAEVIDTKNTKAFSLKYAEVRFSNQCNLACRTCHLEFSTSWHKDHESLYGKAQHTFHSHPDKEKGMINEIEKNIHDLDMIYIAGGEPLIQKQHYDLLNMLIRNNKTHIKLIYDSNLTQLNFGSQSVLKLWKYFPNIQVNASIDGVGEHYELIRHGGKWETVRKNIQTIRLMLPHVALVMVPTISVLNISHLPHMLSYFLSKKIVPNLTFVRLNFLHEPYHYQINTLPEDKRDQVIEDLKKLESPGFEGNIKYIKEAFNKPLVKGQRELFRDFTLKLDALRNEKTAKVCPELRPLLE